LKLVNPVFLLALPSNLATSVLGCDEEPLQEQEQEQEQGMTTLACVQSLSGCLAVEEELNWGQTKWEHTLSFQSVEEEEVGEVQEHREAEQKVGK